MTITQEKVTINTKAYETVADLISSELSDAVGNILKGIEKMANDQESDLSSKFNMPEANQLAKDFIEAFDSLNVDINFSTSALSKRKERTVTPFILLPSGRADDELSTKILAPSRSVKVKTTY